jgi:hypothetical protein
VSDENIVALAEVQTRRRRTPPFYVSDSDLPNIRIEPGQLPRIVDEAEDALVSAANDLYRHGSRLVQVVHEALPVAGGGRAEISRLAEVTVPGLVERFTRAARFEKLDGRTENWRPSDCPKLVAEVYLARGHWRVPPLLGIVTAPTLRPDGTVLDAPGYDHATALLFDPAYLICPPLPAEPTREDAEVALAVLEALIASFPFETNADRAVALSAIITAVIRRALPTAPLHAFTAPVAGSGKSLLVDIAAIIATGRPAAVTSTGRDRFGDAELEKRLTASMLGGDAVISIDNLEAPLGGELLCQLLTQRIVKLRPLGRSVNVEVPNTTAFFATGNNLEIVGDLTRRVLVGALDPRCERPELREFPRDPLEEAERDRPRLVAAALTVVRAFLAAGSPRQEPPLGSYKEWSGLVRDPLIWLSEADPVDTMERVRRGDPRLAALTNVAAEWWRVIGCRRVLAREVIAEALKIRNSYGSEGEAEPWINPGLRDALVTVARGNGREEISPDRIGRWLARNEGRVVSGEDGRAYRFERDGEHANASYWRLSEVAVRDTPF